jgi:hypothetical protein
VEVASKSSLIYIKRRWARGPGGSLNESSWLTVSGEEPSPYIWPPFYQFHLNQIAPGDTQPESAGCRIGYGAELRKARNTGKVARRLCPYTFGARISPVFGRSFTVPGVARTPPRVGYWVCLPPVPVGSSQFHERKRLLRKTSWPIQRPQP